MSLSMSIYIARNRTVLLKRSVRRILLKKNKCVFSRRPKLAMLRSGSRRSLPSAFQTVGPTTANARRPNVSSCILDTTSRRRQAERRSVLCQPRLEKSCPNSVAFCVKSTNLKHDTWPGNDLCFSSSAHVHPAPRDRHHKCKLESCCKIDLGI